jgi:archaemetzincin
MFIYLQPIGEVDSELLEELRIILSSKFGIECKLREQMDMPREAYDSTRNQYHSTTILRFIKRPDDGLAILAVTEPDLFVPSLNFVFGEADPANRRAIISLLRLRQESYGLPKDEALFKERMKKEAVHELGHIFGLPHCDKRECVMHFSNSLYDTDFKKHSFCGSCVRILRTHLP